MTAPPLVLMTTGKKEKKLRSCKSSAVSPPHPGFYRLTRMGRGVTAPPVFLHPAKPTRTTTTINISSKRARHSSRASPLGLFRRKRKRNARRVRQHSLHPARWPRPPNINAAHDKKHTPSRSTANGQRPRAESPSLLCDFAPALLNPARGAKNTDQKKNQEDSVL